MQSILIDNEKEFDFPEPEEVYGNNGCIISAGIVLLYLVTVLYYVINEVV